MNAADVPEAFGSYHRRVGAVHREPSIEEES